MFLETLCELVSSHKADMYDWLYVLLTRWVITAGTRGIKGTESRNFPSLSLFSSGNCLISVQECRVKTDFINLLSHFAEVLKLKNVVNKLKQQCLVSYWRLPIFESTNLQLKNIHFSEFYKIKNCFLLDC